MQNYKRRIKNEIYNKVWYCQSIDKTNIFNRKEHSMQRYIKHITKGYCWKSPLNLL